jgi:hypothetical protein
MSEKSPYATLVEDFAAGYCDGAEPNRLPKGATPEAKNAWFHSIGLEPRRVTMGRRPGSILLNPVAMSLGDAVVGVFSYGRIGEDPVLLAVCNGRLYEWDGTDTFTELSDPFPAPAPFTAGNRVRARPYRENLILFDGTAMWRWNGTALLPVGQDAPTSAPALATAAGPGVTGTYEGYAVWYDPVMEHESSASATSAQVAFVNQSRQWSQPTGTPDAAHTHWRVYVRRVDTSELNFYLAATDLVSAATITEAVSDAARRDPGALPNVNDPPPDAFAVLAEWKGFGIGILPDSDEYVVSKQGDLQSYHPAHVFPVQRGSGQPLTTAQPYGEEFLLQKAHATWRLQGDAVPFTLKPVHSEYGNVSGNSAMEVNGLYYAWDREKGPYVTDTSSWRALASGRVTRVLRTLTRDALGDIQIGHDETNRIVFWAIPVNGSSRLRVILPYQYELGSWLPPMTGLEWHSFTTFPDATRDTTMLIAGDQWGRVYQLFTGDREGVPTTNPMTTLTGTVEAATDSTLTDSTASFYTDGDGLAGMPVAVKSPAGVWQWRRIASNTATVLTLDTIDDAPFSPVPSVGDTYYVGGIEWYFWTAVQDDGDPFLEKRMYHLYVEALALDQDTVLTVQARYNSERVPGTDLDFLFAIGAGAIWGESLWGEALWGASSQQPAKRQLEKTARSAQFRFSNFVPDERIVVTAWAWTDDPQPRRRANAI